ncbi:hypothetical protein M0802_014176 [Mischocyttarus mexicanus]|nr:hypothetical protein M0802_014314 [Mischocyttarus mexicanus]KAI4480485.1 hypothetical protein M0802_014176 [Mischocyttarus mexicanus]
MEFILLLHTLWYLHISCSDIHYIIDFLLTKGYFRFPEVCGSMITYWFLRFSSDFYFPQFIPILNSINGILRLECLATLKSTNPSWQIEHFMDVLKVPKEAAEIYLLAITSRHSKQQ